LAAQRLAQVGKAMMGEHPEQALDILRDVLKACPDAINRMQWTRYPNGGSGSGGGVPGVSEFVGELALWNPQLVMESVRQLETDNFAQPGNERTASWKVATTWIDSDPAGFKAWCEQQDDATFNFGASAFANQLSDRSDYAGAVEWARRIKDYNMQMNALMNSISRWTSTDREAATLWFEQADLPEEARSKLKGYFPASAQ
jgi:hypothetical protein